MRIPSKSRTPTKDTRTMMVMTMLLAVVALAPVNAFSVSTRKSVKTTPSAFDSQRRSTGRATSASLKRIRPLLKIFSANDDNDDNNNNNNNGWAVLDAPQNETMATSTTGGGVNVVVPSSSSTVDGPSLETMETVAAVLEAAEAATLKVTMEGTSGTGTLEDGAVVEEEAIEKEKENDILQEKEEEETALLLETIDQTDSDTDTDTAKPSSSSYQYPPTPTFAQCLNFALPALGIYACPALLSLIDASFIGRQPGAAATLGLAALGPASSLSDNAPLPLLFLSIAATNLMAKAMSQTNKDNNNDDKNNNSDGNNPMINTIRQLSRTSLKAGAMGGTMIGIALYAAAGKLSALYCGESAMAASARILAPLCQTYVQIRALAMPAVVVATVAQALLIGSKDTRTPMIAILVAGVLNFIGDLILVPTHGIAGAAWATSASQVVAAGLLWGALQRRGVLQKPTVAKPVEQQQNKDTTPATTTRTPTTPTSWQTFRQLLSFVPFLLVMAVKVAFHNSNSATAASLGGPPAAAHTALFSVAMLCFTLGDVGSSLSQAFLPPFARTVQVENDKDSRKSSKNKDNNDESKATAKTRTKTIFDIDAARPTISQLLKCTLSISTTVVVLSTLLIGVLGGQITSDPLVLMEMRRILPLVVSTLLVHGMAVTLEGLLVARNDFPALSICYGILAAMIAAFQVATRAFNWGLVGVWSCYVWFSLVRSIVFAMIGGLMRPPRWWQRLASKFGRGKDKGLEAELLKAV